MGREGTERKGKKKNIYKYQKKQWDSRVTMNDNLEFSKHVDRIEHKTTRVKLKFQTI